MSIEVRPLELGDLRQVLTPGRIADLPEEWPLSSMYGLTVTLAGKPIAVGGLIMIRSHWWTFSEITEPARKPMLIHRLALNGLAAADRCGIERIYGYCDETFPRARAWIERMGFRPAVDAEKDDEIREVEAFVSSPAWVRGGFSGC